MVISRMKGRGDTQVSARRRPHLRSKFAGSRKTPLNWDFSDADGVHGTESGPLCPVTPPTPWCSGPTPWCSGSVFGHWASSYRPRTPRAPQGMAATAS